jgi:hypothetical protein
MTTPGATMRTRTALLAAAAAASLAACADDPIYMEPTAPIEVEVGADAVDGVASATASFPLPIRLEREEEAEVRAGRSEELGAQVPYVTVDDLDIEIEWRLENLSDTPALARVQLNGANELFEYVPADLVVDPEEDEPPPPLAGDTPIALEPLASFEGVFREDQLAEASLDLELMSRGGLSPFTAVLAVDERRGSFRDTGGVDIPKDAWASLIRLDLIVLADQHVLFEYNVRVRDHRDPELTHPLLLEAPAGELTTFAPTAVTLPPAEEP